MSTTPNTSTPPTAAGTTSNQTPTRLLPDPARPAARFPNLDELLSGPPHFAAATTPATPLYDRQRPSDARRAPDDRGVREGPEQTDDWPPDYDWPDPMEDLEPPPDAYEYWVTDGETEGDEDEHLIR